MTPRYPWIARLRACPDIPEAAVTLAETAGGAAAAVTAGVFLLDRTGAGLLPHGVWSAGGGGEPGAGASVALEAQDPLCFALRTGAPYMSDLRAGMPESPCAALLPAAPGLRGLAAFPLIAGGNRSVGGVLLGLVQPPAREEETALICDFGALVLDGLIRRRRDGALLHSLHEDVARLSARAGDGSAGALLIGGSRAMQRVRERIAKAAPTDVAVLLTGETGTGKELAACALHAQSPRRDAPFVKINCGALPAQLLESELFGHKKGAFSGAESDHIGLLRSAEGGTVLLDEIGEMPPELQVKLLRVLQDREVRPVGDVRSHAVNIRIIAATNADMETAIQQGTFRRDLYHRLRVFHVCLPPLRERREDVPELAQHFVGRFCREYGRPALAPTAEAYGVLYSLPYPGNVRELEGKVRQAVILAEPGLARLGPELFLAAGETRRERRSVLPELVDSYVAGVIAGALERHAGNTAEAARELGIPRRTLSYKIRKMADSEQKEDAAGPPGGRARHGPGGRTNGVDAGREP